MKIYLAATLLAISFLNTTVAQEIQTYFSENLDGYQPVEFRACIIEFSKEKEEPLLVVIGEGSQLAQYDIRAVPEDESKYKEQPDYWQIRVVGKPKAPNKNKEETPEVWVASIPLLEYAPVIKDDELKNVIGIVEEATGKKAIQPTRKVIGKKGIEIIGAKKTIRMTFEFKDEK